jgi:hypothetical protein
MEEKRGVRRNDPHTWPEMFDIEEQIATCDPQTTSALPPRSIVLHCETYATLTHESNNHSTGTPQRLCERAPRRAGWTDDYGDTQRNADCGASPDSASPVCPACGDR